MVLRVEARDASGRWRERAARQGPQGPGKAGGIS